MGDQDGQWAIVELMGHVRTAGRLTEEEHYGGKLGRLDVPAPPNPDCLACKGTGRVPAVAGIARDVEHACRMPECNAFVTQLFGGGSVYRITFVAENVARSVAQQCSPAPVSLWEPQKRLQGPDTRPVYDDEDY